MVNVIDGVVRDQVVRVADLAVTRSVVGPLEFRNCRFIGPAVVALLNESEIDSCTFDGSADTILWEIPESSVKIGAIGFDSCRFVECRFEMIGFAAPPIFAAQLREALAGASQ